MNGKPVFFHPAKTVINFKSKFKEKLLCDGLTFSTGTACAYSCSFCYVPAMMVKSGLEATTGKHDAVVIRRESAIETMRKQLLDGKGRPRFAGDDHRVIYASPLVDVAANMELVAETVEACKLILELTGWHIRLLSKSSLLPKIAEQLDTIGGRARVIYGVSTGTFDDALCKAFEAGTPLVSKRIASLHVLQDAGFRTFGMVCPSLPVELGGYDDFAHEARTRLRYDRCEHVWAEVINLRGESFTRTVKALRDAGHNRQADLVVEVTCPDRWEQYARNTFCAHVVQCDPRKLRFLQYVNKSNREWWEERAHFGAVLL